MLLQKQRHLLYLSHSLWGRWAALCRCWRRTLMFHNGITLWLSFFWNKTSSRANSWSKRTTWHITAGSIPIRIRFWLPHHNTFPVPLVVRHGLSPDTLPVNSQRVFPNTVMNRGGVKTYDVVILYSCFFPFLLLVACLFVVPFFQLLSCNPSDWFGVG